MLREDVTGAVGFPSTQWSLVGRAGHISCEQRREALATLLHRYLPALRAHLLLGKRLSADQTDDLIQGFVADKIIEQNLVAQAEQGKGKFRSFLLAALNYYVVGRFRHETARKRSPAQRMLNIADQQDVSSVGADPCDMFTLVWARQVVADARRRMEAHCQAVNRADLWTIFTERILRPAADNAAPPPHQRIAGALKLESSKEASNLLITAKRLFARSLRLVVGEYVGDKRAIDEEIDDLMRILSRHG